MYSVVFQDANSRVWEKTAYKKTSEGTVISRKHRYVELGAGLNYKNAKGEWVGGRDQIDILPQGAAATRGQHKVYFPADIYNGVIETVTSDGKHLKSRPVAVGYKDGSNTVLIATLKHSVGRVVSSNEVIYADAFTDFKADLVCTYRRDGFESDVVFREQPARPHLFGLNDATSTVQMITEFFDTPEPQKVPSKTDRIHKLRDTTLKFGTLTMGQGKAFTVGNRSTAAVSVYKSWVHLQGRTLLIEETPLDYLKKDFAALPPAMVVLPVQNSADPALHIVSAERLLPAARGVAPDTNQMTVALVDLNKTSGVVLDYVELNTEQSDYVFQADTTYYITAPVYISGTATFEGGTVIKYAHGSSITASNLICKTAPYRPAVFTAVDDDTAGEILPDSNGSPSGYYANVALEIDAAADIELKYMKFAYASVAVYTTAGWNCYGCYNFTLDDVQMLHCGYGTQVPEVTTHVNNCLFVDMNVCLQGDDLYGSAANLTVDGCNVFASDSQCFDFWVNNSIFANVATLADTVEVHGDHCLLYNSDSNRCVSCVQYNGGSLSVAFANSYYTDVWPFQAVGAGHYYLPTNSPYRNAGVFNSVLAAELRTKTTSAPMVYSNFSIWEGSATFDVQAPRDSNALPDLGYHYDPLDYLLNDVTFNGGFTLAFGPGVAVGWFGTASNNCGIAITDSDSIVRFMGTATEPCWFVGYNTTQEGEAADWTVNDSAGIILASDLSPNIVGQFAKWSLLGGVSSHFAAFDQPMDYDYVSLSHCEFYGGNILGFSSAAFNFNNSLFSRVTLLMNNDSGYGQLGINNCTFWNGNFLLSNTQEDWGLASDWQVKNTAFDGTAISMNGGLYSWLNFYNNAYRQGAGQIPYDGDDVTVSSFNWQHSWFGDFYRPANSPLNNAGYEGVDEDGLFHFTTQTNQVKDVGTVDIGYHYVAADGNGNPMDTNGDDVPDYLADANGDGIVNNGEISWMFPPPFVTEPVDQTVDNGGNVTFTAAVTPSEACGPLIYQWQHNGTNFCNLITTVVGNGSYGYSGDGGAATNASLANPAGLSFDGDTLYIADPSDNVVRKVDGNGIITTIAGTGNAGYSGDGGFDLTQSDFNYPSGVAPDMWGDLFIADTQNHAIRQVWNYEGENALAGIAGNGNAGYSGDGDYAVNATLNYPLAISLDDWGDLYIADTQNNVVREIYPDGTITTFAGNGSPGYSGDGDYAVYANLNAPSDVVADGWGNVFIADTQNHVIREVWNYEGEMMIMTVAGNGNPGYSGDGGAATDANLNSPTGLALDGAGNLYIADSQNHVVRKVDSSGIITTVAGNGIQGYSGDNGTAAAASLNYPSRVAVDSAGNLYIADSQNSVVRKVVFSDHSAVEGGTLKIFNATMDDAGTYTVTVSSPCGTLVSSNAVLTVRAIPPSIAVPPGNLVATQGNNATFSVSATGSAPLHYQWRFNGGNIAGANSAALTLGNVQSGNAGNYSVVVTNNFGSVTSSVVTLTVLVPPSITVPPGDQTSIQGNTVTFSVVAAGTAPLGYQWYFNSSILTDATNSVLNLVNLQPPQMGLYKVAISNCAGSVTSAPANLILAFPPIISGFAPVAGPAGATITISGTNFDATASSNIVCFGAVRATVLAATVTNLLVVVPSGGTYAPITVTAKHLTGWSRLPFIETFCSSGSITNPASFGPEMFMAQGTGNNPGQLVMADLNNDGTPDLIADYGNDTITIYQNNDTNGVPLSTNLFTRIDLHAGTRNINWIAVADLTGDGARDIIVVDGSTNRVTVLKNLCSGGNLTTNSFASPVSFAVVAPTVFGTGVAMPASVAVQDMDGDGKPEIVVVNGGPSFNGGYVGLTFTVLKNACLVGSVTMNSFVATTNFWTAPGPIDASIADIDGDAKPDVVVADNPYAGVAPSGAVNRNVTTGPGKISFAPQNYVSSNISHNGRVVAVADLDGDGKLDLMFVGSSPANYVSVTKNTSTPGANSFASQIGLFLGPVTSRRVIAGDLDGDGKPDIITSGQSTNGNPAGLNRISVFKNTSVPGALTANSFANATDFLVTGSRSPNGMAAGDLDGDGRPDLGFIDVQNNCVVLRRNLVPFGGAPIIATQPSSQTVVVGQTAVLTVAATGACGAVPLNYQWYFGSTAIANATSASLTLNNVQTGDAGNYHVVVSNAAGNVASSDASVTVLVPPSITTQPSSLTATQGNNVTFTVAASGTSPLGYQWYFGSTAIANATSTSLTINNVQATDAGNYHVAVANGAGSVTSADASLAVLLPPTITTQPSGQAVTQGSTVTLNVVASGSTPLAYQWYFNGTAIAGATSATLTLVNVQPANQGLYHVTVANSAGSVTSSDAAVSLTCNNSPGGLVGWWPANGDAIDYVNGNNGTLNGGATYASGTVGGQAFSFNGSTAYVDLGTRPDFEMSYTFSFEGWIYPTGPGSGGDQGGILINNENKYEVARFSDGTIRPAFANIPDWINSGAIAPLNQWSHVAVVYDNGIVKTYLNGILAHTYNGEGSIGRANWTGPDDFRIGGRSAPTLSQFFQGSIDEVSIYNRALSAAEIASIYGAGSAGKCLPPWPLPPSPAGVMATTISSSQISLTWNQSFTNGATRISIERKAGANGTYAEVAPLGKTMSYIDTNLVSGTTYYYRLRAGNFNSVTWSPYSAEVQATTLSSGSDIPFANLLFWLKADSGSFLGPNSTIISAWQDQSGRDNDAVQSSSGNCPVWTPAAIGNWPVVRFDGNGKYLNLPYFMNGASQGEALAVLKVATPPGGHGTLWFLGSSPFSVGSGSDAPMGYPFWGGTQIADNFGSTIMNFMGPPIQSINQYHVYEVSAKPNDWKAWLNGISQYQTANNTVGFGNSALALGSFQWYGTGYGWDYNGDIAEILIFNKALTTDERAAVNQYLNTKYGFVQGVTISTPQNESISNIPDVPVSARTFGIMPTQVEFFQGTTSIGSISSVNQDAYNLTWHNVANGTYTLTARATDSSGILWTSVPVTLNVLLAPVVSDFGFELPVVGYGNQIDRPTGTAWSYTGNCGVTDNARGNWLAVQTPEGNQAAYLNDNGGVGSATISQSVYFTNGFYTISFLAAANGANNGCSFNVTVDGMIVDSFNPTSATYTRFTTAAFHVLNGYHTISFVGTGPPDPRTTMLDDVHVNAALYSPGLLDFGFEIPVVGSGNQIDRPTGTAWSYTGNCGVVDNNRGAWMTVHTPQGNQAAYLNDNSGAGTISQSAYFTNGVYILRLIASTDGIDPGCPFNVMLDGNVIGNISPVAAAYDTYFIGPFTVAEGFHTIAFAGTGSGSQTAMIDDVNILTEYVALKSPQNGAIFSQGSSVTLGATAISALGPIAQVEFFAGTTRLGVATQAPFTWTWSDAVEGDYVLTAKATDSQGNIATSQPISVTCVDASHCRPAPSGIVAWWPANGDSNDYVGNGSGTLVGSVSYADGIAGQAFNFVNDSDGLSANSITGLNDGGASTIEGWIKISELPPGGMAWILLFGPNGGGSEHWLLNPDGSTHLGVWGDGSMQFQPVLPVGEWIHLAITSDGQTLCCYTNGVLQSSIPGTFNFSSTSLSLGTGYNGGHPFKGAIDELAIYNRALSSTEVAALYLAGSHGKCLSPWLPTVSLTSPVNNSAFDNGADVALTANASRQGGDITTVEYYAGSTKVGSSSAAPNFAATWHHVLEGNYTLTARAIGDNGVSASSDPITIAVDPPNSITIINPSDRAVLSAATDISFGVNWFDRAGIDHVEYFQAATSLGTAGAAPFGLTWHNVPDGVYALTAHATDHNGLILTSAVVRVIVDSDSFAEDRDGDGVSDGQEVLNSTDPLDYYNGVLPRLKVVSGNQQYGRRESCLPNALTVEVLDTDNNALANAPVTFTAAQGGVATTASDPSVGSLALKTDAAGMASVYFTLPVATNWQYIVQARAQTDSGSTSAMFIEHARGAAVAAGWLHDVALKDDGTVWTWGLDENGQLGDGHNAPLVVPVQVGGLSNIVAVVSEDESSSVLALDTNGMVFAWGANESGELGMGDGLYIDQNVPVAIPALSNVVAIAGGAFHSVALESDGTVWTWGYNGLGELGDETSDKRDDPEPLTVLSNVVAIASGSDHCFALCADGTVWGWGFNKDGELAIGYTSRQSLPVQVPGVADVIALSGGYSQSLALRSDGTVLAWGEGKFGELGVDAYTDAVTPIVVVGLSNITAIASGGYHNLAIDINRMLFEWGDGSWNQMGNGSKDSPQIVFPFDMVSNVVAVAGGAYSSLIATGDGIFYQWGNYSFNNSDWLYHIFPFMYDPSNRTDTDGDGLPDWYEPQVGSSPTSMDGNGDGITDYYQVFWAVDPANLLPLPLSKWKFDTDDWLGEAGQTPVAFDNIQLVPDWSSNALHIGTNLLAKLAYHVVNTDLSPVWKPTWNRTLTQTQYFANLTLPRGTIRLWFKPDWDSVSAGGVGPGAKASLIAIGNHSSDFSSDYWGLEFDPNGDTLRFSAEGSGQQHIYCDAPVTLSSNRWYYITLTYDAASSAIYTNGTIVASGGGAAVYPAPGHPEDLTFNVGSTADGTAQAFGRIDNLETFNYSQDAPTVKVGLYQSQGTPILQWPSGGSIFFSSGGTFDLNVYGAGFATIAVLVNDDNLADAVPYTYYATPDIKVPVNLGTADGVYIVRVGVWDGTEYIWTTRKIVIDTTAPVVEPAGYSMTTNSPLLQLKGFANEMLASITFDVTNAESTNVDQMGFVTRTIGSTLTGAQATNWFQCFDIKLAPGLNTIVVRCADMAGNITTNTYYYTLDVSAMSAPALAVNWPLPDMPVSGNLVTIRGHVDDPTATVIAYYIAADDSTNEIDGVIERDGRFWIDNLPLLDGDNTVMLVATNVAGLCTTNTITVQTSPVTVTVDPIAAESLAAGDTISMSGTVGSEACGVSVNGVSAMVTPNGDGSSSWAANNVPVSPGGVATYEVFVNSINGDFDGLAMEGNISRPVIIRPSRYHESLNFNSQYHIIRAIDGTCPYWIDYGLDFKISIQTTRDWEGGKGGSGSTDYFFHSDTSGVDGHDRPTIFGPCHTTWDWPTTPWTPDLAPINVNQTCSTVQMGDSSAEPFLFFRDAAAWIPNEHIDYRNDPGISTGPCGDIYLLNQSSDTSLEMVMNGGRAVVSQPTTVLLQATATELYDAWNISYQPAPGLTGGIPVKPENISINRLPGVDLGDGRTSLIPVYVPAGVDSIDITPNVTTASGSYVFDVKPTTLKFESRDRLIHGTIPGTVASEISIRIETKNTHRSYGEYHDLFANLRPWTRICDGDCSPQIYNNEAEILSDTEVDAIDNGTAENGDQKVVFVRDPNNPALLNFYLIADDYETLSVVLTVRNGTKTSVVKQDCQLTKSDLGDVITYLDQKIDSVDLISGTFSSHAALTPSSPPPPIQQRNLLTKVMLQYFRDTINPQLALVKGLVEGFIGGVKSDWSGIVGVKDLLTSSAQRAAAFKALTTWKTYAQIPSAIVNSMQTLMNDANRNAVTFRFGDPDFSDDLSVRAYVGGYAMGYTVEQIVVAAVGVGIVAKGSKIAMVVTKVTAGEKVVVAAANAVKTVQAFKSKSVVFAVNAAKKTARTTGLPQAAEAMADTVAKMPFDGTRTVGEVISTYVDRIDLIHEELNLIGQPINDFGIKAQQQLATLLDRDLGFFPGEKALRADIMLCSKLESGARYDDFIKGFTKPDGTVAKDQLKASLEAYYDITRDLAAGECPALPVKGIDQIYSKLYHYTDESILLDTTRAQGVDGVWSLSTHPSGRYITPENLNSQVVVKDRFQLPLKQLGDGSFVDDPAKGRFKIEFNSTQVADDCAVPQAYRHSVSNPGFKDTLEPACTDNPICGNGHGIQFTEKNALTGATVTDLKSGQIVRDRDHLLQLLNDHP